jgi:hypothetical protein
MRIKFPFHYRSRGFVLSVGLTDGFNKIILNGVSFPKICRAETGFESMQRRALGSTLSTIRSRTIVLNPKEAHYLIGIGLDILFPDLGENS